MKSSAFSSNFYLNSTPSSHSTLTEGRKRTVRDSLVLCFHVCRETLNISCVYLLKKYVGAGEKGLQQLESIFHLRLLPTGDTKKNRNRWEWAINVSLSIIRMCWKVFSRYAGKGMEKYGNHKRFVKLFELWNIVIIKNKRMYSENLFTVHFMSDEGNNAWEVVRNGLMDSFIQILQCFRSIEIECIRAVLCSYLYSD